MWQVQKIADEGTGEPYIARLWAGAMELRDLVLRHRATSEADYEVRRKHFDELHQPILDALGATRKHAARIDSLVAQHREKVASGSIISRQRNALQINETIHVELQELIAAFLSAAARATKSLQSLVEYLDLDISFLFQKQQRFTAAVERLRAEGDGELADYLAATRMGWSETLVESRHALEHKGWRLPDVTYVDSPEGRVTLVEPQVDGRAVSEFVAVMTDRLLGFTEDMLALAVQRGVADVGDLIDVPRQERDRAHVKRFRFGVPALQPQERFWRLLYSDRAFYDS